MNWHGSQCSCCWELIPHTCTILARGVVWTRNIEIWNDSTPSVCQELIFTVGRYFCLRVSDKRDMTLSHATALCSVTVASWLQGYIRVISRWIIYCPLKIRTVGSFVTVVVFSFIQHANYKRETRSTVLTPPNRFLLVVSQLVIKVSVWWPQVISLSWANKIMTYPCEIHFSIIHFP
jgi:hypothetical protein